MSKVTKWKMLAKYLFDELTYIDDDFMDIEDVKYYYDESVTKSQYNKATKYVNNLINDAKFYYVDDRELMLELHDDHIFWDISLPCNNNYPELEYHLLVEEKCDKFTKLTGVEIGCYGRGGRHVCITSTFENLENYSKYKELAKTLEKEIIKYYQDYVDKSCA